MSDAAHDQHAGQPRHVDVGKSLDFALYGLRQVVILDRHKTAQAHAVFVFKGLAEGLRVLAQARDRIRRPGGRSMK
jgi:hypothetical protein